MAEKFNIKSFETSVPDKGVNAYDVSKPFETQLPPKPASEKGVNTYDASNKFGTQLPESLAVDNGESATKPTSAHSRVGNALTKLGAYFNGRAEKMAARRAERSNNNAEQENAEQVREALRTIGRASLNILKKAGQMPGDAMLAGIRLSIDASQATVNAGVEAGKTVGREVAINSSLIKEGVKETGSTIKDMSISGAKSLSDFAARTGDRIDNFVIGGLEKSYKYSKEQIFSLREWFAERRDKAKARREERRERNQARKEARQKARAEKIKNAKNSIANKLENGREKLARARTVGSVAIGATMEAGKTVWKTSQEVNQALKDQHEVGANYRGRHQEGSADNTEPIADSAEVDTSSDTSELETPGNVGEEAPLATVHEISPKAPTAETAHSTPDQQAA